MAESQRWTGQPKRRISDYTACTCLQRWELIDALPHTSVSLSQLPSSASAGMDKTGFSLFHGSKWAQMCVCSNFSPYCRDVLVACSPLTSWEESIKGNPWSFLIRTQWASLVLFNLCPIAFPFSFIIRQQDSPPCTGSAL